MYGIVLMRVFKTRKRTSFKKNSILVIVFFSSLEVGLVVTIIKQRNYSKNISISIHNIPTENSL
jgi:hypothetical protein